MPSDDLPPLICHPSPCSPRVLLYFCGLRQSVVSGGLHVVRSSGWLVWLAGESTVAIWNGALAARGSLLRPTPLINLSSRGDAQQQLGLWAIGEALCLQRADIKHPWFDPMIYW